MTRNGQPGRTVMVGWMLRFFSTMRWPAWLVLSGRRFSDRLDEVALVAVESDLAADAEQRRHRDAFQERPGVEIDLVLETGIAGGVGRRQEPPRPRPARAHDGGDNSNPLVCL
jgi:hypothetical protein